MDTGIATVGARGKRKHRTIRRAGDRKKGGQEKPGGRRNAKDKEERGLTGGQSVASQEGRVGGRVGGGRCKRLRSLRSRDEMERVGWEPSASNCPPSA